MRIYYKECFIEDIYHFDALDVLEGLKIGDTVCLYYADEDPCYKGSFCKDPFCKDPFCKDPFCKDPRCKDPHYKERIMVKTSGDEEKILGALSIEDSKSMLPFLKNKWKDLFSGQVCFADKTKKGENNRIEIVIYINENR